MFSKCPTDKPVRFSCGDSSGPQFTSDEISSLNFKTTSCIKFDKGYLNPQSNDFQLAVDNHRNPTCGQSESSYNIFMNWPGNHWYCNGITNTQSKSGWWFSVSYKDTEEGKLFLSYKISANRLLNLDFNKLLYDQEI